MAKCPDGQVGRGGQCVPLPANAVCSPSIDDCQSYKCDAGYFSGKV